MNCSKTTRLKGEWKPVSIISKSSKPAQPLTIGLSPDPMAETNVWSLLIILDNRVAGEDNEGIVLVEETKFDESKDTKRDDCLRDDGLKDSTFQRGECDDEEEEVWFDDDVLSVWLATILFTRQQAGIERPVRLFIEPRMAQSLFRSLFDEWICKLERLISLSMVQWFATASSPYKSCKLKNNKKIRRISLAQH